MKRIQLLITSVANTPTPSERNGTKRGKIIDIDNTTSYLLNSRITESNLTKFLCNVQK